MHIYISWIPYMHISTKVWFVYAHFYIRKPTSINVHIYKLAFVYARIYGSELLYMWIYKN
jgi:hypothetical protein